MASLLKRSGVWYANFYDASRTPKQKRHSLKTTSKRTAGQMLSKLEDAYRLGEWDAWTESPDDFFHAELSAAPKRVNEVVSEFQEWARRTLAKSTFRAYESYSALFEDVMGSTTFIETVTADDVERYMNGPGRSGRPPSQGSRRQRLTVVKSLFSFCVERGYVREKPSDDVTRPQRPSRLPKAVTDEEFTALLEAIPDTRAWTRTLFRFKALTGLRISELARLRWDDVDMERRLIRIHVQKNGKAQTQPFTQSALALLEGIERLGPFVFTAPNAYAERTVESWQRDVEQVFADARKAAGIDRHITPHGLRHRYATKLAEKGAGAFLVASAMRHADVKTSQVYVHVSNNRLREELDSLFG